MHRRDLLALTAVALAAIAIVTSPTWLVEVGLAPGIDLSREPETTLEKIPFEVGESYTLGTVHIGPDVPRPVRITEVTIVQTTGLDVLGVGWIDSDSTESGIGLVPEWPPAGVTMHDGLSEPVSAPGDIGIIVGIRTTAPKSGLRGVIIRWMDGTGGSSNRTIDLAVVTCSPRTCEAEGDSAPLLRELGLLTP